MESCRYADNVKKNFFKNHTACVMRCQAAHSKHLSFLAALLRQFIHDATQPFQVYKSVVFSVDSQIGATIPTIYFNDPKKEPFPSPVSSFAPHSLPPKATTDLLSVFISFPVLNISYGWNHRICVDVCFWHAWMGSQNTELWKQTIGHCEGFFLFKNIGV